MLAKQLAAHCCAIVIYSLWMNCTPPQNVIAQPGQR